MDKVTRRVFVGKVGGIVAASFLPSAKSAEGGGTTPGKQERESQNPEATEVSPVEDLMREHGILSRCLLIYDAMIARTEKGMKFSPEPLAETAGLIRRFIEEYHEKLEETYIFPGFLKAGKLADLGKILQEQHQAGRRLTERILKSAMVEAAETANLQIHALVRQPENWVRADP